MAAKRVLFLSILAALRSLTGCRMFCDRHYPCQPQCAPTCCMPCCPQGAGYTPPPPPPPQPAVTNNWGSSGQGNCCCAVPQTRQ